MGYRPDQTKVCLYCGRSNPVSASTCEGCGATRFQVVALPAIPQPQWEMQPPSQPLRVEQIEPVIRVLYFFFIGFIVGFLWLLATLCVFVTVVGWPLARAMFKVLLSVATLYRSPQYGPGEILRSGWNESIERYKAAPIYGKVLAPLAFVLCAAGIAWLLYG
jgi:hypothetical protein